jgi:hypothetical protein
MLQVLDSLFAIGAGLDLEPGALEGAGEEAPEGIVVFGEKDAGHVGLFPEKGRRRWMATVTRSL